MHLQSVPWDSSIKDSRICQVYPFYFEYIQRTDFRIGGQKNYNPEMINILYLADNWYFFLFSAKYNNIIGGKLN